MRSSGVLMHISSLPSPYGIGTMGKEARKFVDFLDKSGQKYWQILPICPTSYAPRAELRHARAGQEVIHHISHFPVLQEILILSILRFYAEKNC